MMSDRVYLVAPASPIKCLLYLPYARATQYKLGPERLTQLEKIKCTTAGRGKWFLYTSIYVSIYLSNL